MLSRNTIKNLRGSLSRKKGLSRSLKNAEQGYQAVLPKAARKAMLSWLMTYCG